MSPTAGDAHRRPRLRSAAGGVALGAALWLAARPDALAAAEAAPAPAAPSTSVQTFDSYGPLATNAALLDRMLSPLAAEAAHRRLAATGTTLADRPIDLAGERFVVHVPTVRPAPGYGLLAFISPSERADLPSGWAAVLDEAGVIYVAAARSGNDENVVTRRAPLALLAAHNVAQRYPLDPARVYVGGFSGGSRVAMRLALAYPDLFRGAFLNAGSDPIAVSPARLPGAPLFAQFQARSRLAYATGALDAMHVGMDDASLASMRRWCVFATEAREAPGVGHEIADARALRAGLTFLERPATPDAGRLAACRERTERDVRERVARAAALVDARDRDKARKALLDLDATAGGLAMPELLDLARRCDCHVLDP